MISAVILLQMNQGRRCVRMRVNVIWFIGIIFLMVSVFSLAQEEGCFLHPESTAYCSDVSLDLAQQECAFFEQCPLEKVFFKGESCKDIVRFSQCQEILCKSTCDKKLLGQCEAGAISPSEQDTWCSKGCCRLNYLGENHCSYKTSKWLCEVDARNKQLTEFVFTSLLEEKECVDYCNQEIVVGGAQGVLVADSVSALPELVLPTPKNPVVVPKYLVGSIGENETMQLSSSKKGDSESKNNDSFFIVIVGLIIFLLIVSLLFHYFHQRLKRGLEEVPFFSSLEEKALPWWMSPFQKSAAMEERLSKLERAHAHKMKEGKRKEFLTEFGLVVENKGMDHFTKLRHLGAIYERRKQEVLFGLKKEEKAALEKLSELVKTIPSTLKSGSLPIKSSSVKNELSLNSTLKKGTEDVLKELRKMVQKK